MDIGNESADVDDTSFSKNRRNISTRRRNKKRIRKCIRTNLNTSRGNAALLKMFNRSSGAMNTTLVRTETMRSNNKALAQALAMGKKELRDCYSAINKVREENTYLTEQLYTLQRVAGAQNNEIENEVQMRLDIRVRDIKKILVVAAKQLQDGVHTLGEGLDLCVMSSPRSSTSMSSTRGRSTFGVMDCEAGVSPLTRMAPSSTIFDSTNSRPHFIPLKQKTTDVALPSSECSPTKVRVSSEFLPVQRENDIQEMSLIAEQSVLIDDDMLILNEANFLVDRLSRVSEGAEIHQENTGQEESSSDAVRPKKASVRNTAPLREPVTAKPSRDKNQGTQEGSDPHQPSEDNNQLISDPTRTSLATKLRRETVVLSKGLDAESSSAGGGNQELIISDNDIQLVEDAECTSVANTDLQSTATSQSRRVTFVKPQLPSVQKSSDKSTTGKKDKKQLAVKNGSFLPVCKAANIKQKAIASNASSVKNANSPKGSFILVPREETVNISPEITDKIQPSRFASEDPSKWRMTFFVPGQTTPPGEIAVPEADIAADTETDSTAATEPETIAKQPVSKAVSTCPAASHLEAPVSGLNNFVDEDCTLYFNSDMEMTEPINYNSLLAAMNNRTQTVENSMAKATGSDEQSGLSALKSTDVGSEKGSSHKADKQCADPPVPANQVSHVDAGSDNDFGFASIINGEEYEDDMKPAASSMPEITVTPPIGGSQCPSSGVVSQTKTELDKHMPDYKQKTGTAAGLSDNPDKSDNYGHRKKIVRPKVQKSNIDDSKISNSESNNLGGNQKAGDSYTQQKKTQLLKHDDKIAPPDQAKSMGSNHSKTSYREMRNPVNMHESSSSDSESLKSTERSDSDQRVMVKAAVELRLPKPGKIIFAASRKKVDGYRDPVPSKIPGKSRSKQKKYPVSKGVQGPASMTASLSTSPPSLFDFHDRTPLVTKEKGEKIKSVYDISMNETVVENRPTYEQFKEKVASNKVKDAEGKVVDEESAVDNSSNRRTAYQEKVGKTQKIKQATKPRTKSRKTDADNGSDKAELSSEHEEKDIDNVVAKKKVKKDDSVFKVPEGKPQVKSRARKCPSAEADILISDTSSSARTEQNQRTAEGERVTTKPASSSESDDGNMHATKVSRRTKPKRRVIESDSEEEEEEDDPDFYQVRTKAKKVAPKKQQVSRKSMHEKQAAYKSSETELNKNSPVKEKSRTKPRTKKKAKQAETMESVTISDDNVLKSDAAKNKMKCSDGEQTAERTQAELDNGQHSLKSTTKRKMTESSSEHDMVVERTKSEIDSVKPKKKKADVNHIGKEHQPIVVAEPDCDVIIASQPPAKTKIKSSNTTKKYVEAEADDEANNDVPCTEHSDSTEKKLTNTRRKTLPKPSMSNAVSEDDILIPDTPVHVTKRSRRQTKVLNYADDGDDEVDTDIFSDKPVTRTEKLQPEGLEDHCLKNSSEKVQVSNETLSSKLHHAPKLIESTNVVPLPKTSSSKRQSERQTDQDEIADDSSGVSEEAVRRTSDCVNVKLHGAKPNHKSTKLSRKSISAEQSEDSNLTGQLQQEQLHEKLLCLESAMSRSLSANSIRHSTAARLDDKENDVPLTGVDGCPDKRSRRGAACVSYKEPSLGSKLRQGDPHTKEIYDGAVVMPHNSKKAKMSMGRKGSKASSNANTPLNSP